MPVHSHAITVDQCDIFITMKTFLRRLASVIAFIDTSLHVYKTGLPAKKEILRQHKM